MSPDAKRQKKDEVAEQKAEPCAVALSSGDALRLDTASHDCQLLNLKPVGAITMLLTTDSQLYNINDSYENLEVNRGTFLAGYRSGKWQIAVDVTDNDVKYDLTDGNSMVTHDNRYRSLYEIVLERRKEKPDKANLCYDEVLDKPTAEQPAFFEGVIRRLKIRRLKNKQGLKNISDN